MSARTRRLLLLATAVTVAVVALAGWWYATTPRRTAAKAIRAYDVALAQALRQLDPELLASAAMPAEQQRVTNYITLLWGRGVALDARLDSLEVIEVHRDGESTLVAQASEDWTYQEVDSTTGVTVGDSYTETMELTYTIVLEDGVWMVERSRIREDDAAQEGPK